MTSAAPTGWGVIATVNAPTETTMDFCAHHLDLGARRIYIYLDDASDATYKALKSLENIKVIQCDDHWWAKRNGRPEKHQVRQVLNARHACNRRAEVAWLTHIDVDEFLVSDRRVDDILADLAPKTLCARVRPIEALSPDPADPTDTTLFKAFHLNLDERNKATEAIYPEFGRYLSGGFLSHVAGKMFFRAGIGMKVKIHNAYLDDVENPEMVELPDLALAHLHAETWEKWRAQFDYRLQFGSYRDELAPPPGRKAGGVNMHQMFTALQELDGEAGLKRFHREVCVATPELQERLTDHGLLRVVDLDLARKRAQHFPDP